MMFDLGLLTKLLSTISDNLLPLFGLFSPKFLVLVICSLLASVLTCVLRLLDLLIHTLTLLNPLFLIQE